MLERRPNHENQLKGRVKSNKIDRKILSLKKYEYKMAKAIIVFIELIKWSYFDFDYIFSFM